MTQLELIGGPIQDPNRSPFDVIRRVDADGEHWRGRELMPLLGYEKWERFADMVERAVVSIDAAARLPEETAGHHVSHRREAVAGGLPGAVRADYRLTRYGAYMTSLNGDVRKKQVAAAQRYFVMQARRAELSAANPVIELDELAAAERYVLAIKEKRAAIARAEIAEAHVAELVPRAAQADHQRKAQGLATVATFCTDLQLWARENHGVKLLHDEIRDYLGDIHFVIRAGSRRNEPYAEAVKAGHVRQVKGVYDTTNHGSFETVATRLTPKGWGYAWDRAVMRLAEHGSLKPITAVAKT